MKAMAYRINEARVRWDVPPLVVEPDRWGHGYFMGILGHATLAMTMRYSHPSPRHLRDKMKKTDTAAAIPAEMTNPRAQKPVDGVVLLDK